MFLFPILRECTLVKCHCDIFIELVSSTIGQQAKRVLRHRAKLDQCASGHKSIIVAKKSLITEFNQSKAKTNDNCSKLSASDPYEKRRAKNTRYKNPQLVAHHEQICCATSCKFDGKRAIKPNFVVTLVWVAGRPIVNYTVVVCFSFFRDLVSRIPSPYKTRHRPVSQLCHC